MAELGPSRGFAQDTRFGGTVPPPPAPPPEDPSAIAFAEGFAAGTATAEAEAERIRIEADAAREKLELAFARFDAEQAENLRQRLYDTVAALCETALAPLALDTEALVRRIERAVAMLARADDDRVIRLHPDDLALIGARLPDGWTISPDPALARGALRIETSNGGVEDGPESWRQAIAEALAKC